jgi:aspartate kinase
MLLATGEQQSVALMAIALHRLGFPAVSLNAVQAGIKSSSNYSNARIKEIDVDRIHSELERNNIVIIAGFQGVNRYGDITTLGRGASDTTAVALCAALHADLCEIYTDVDGIYTTDEMLELATLGAKVLHNRSVELAKKYKVKMVVRSSMTNEPGTLVKDREGNKVESMFVSGVAVDEKIGRISLLGIEDVPGSAFKIFSALAKKKISVDIILQSVGRDGKKDVSFTVAHSDMDEAYEILKQGIGEIEYNITKDDTVAKLSIVGAGMETNFGVAAMFFEALYDVGINIDMISTSEIKISVLVPKEDAERGRKAIHAKFFNHKD